MYEGTTITLYISKGTDTYVVENFIGQNVNEVKIKLEEIYNLSVIITDKVVDNENPVENEIIDQSIDPGQRLRAGQTIILYVAKIFAKYPDMVSEGWTENDVNTFAESYELDLIIDYKETDAYREGAVMYQSRAAGSEIVNKSSFRVTIAKAKTEPDTPSLPDNKDDSNNGNGEDAIG